MKPWMIWDIEREREKREREAEVGRGLWLPIPLPPPGWEPTKPEKKEEVYR